MVKVAAVDTGNIRQMFVEGTIENDKLTITGYNYLLLLEKKGKAKVRRLKEFLEHFFGNKEFDLVILEIPGKRFKKKNKNPLSPKDYSMLLNITEVVKNFLLDNNINTKIIKPSIGSGFGNEFEQKGWKQILTGLNKPADIDIIREVKSLERLGKIKIEADISLLDSENKNLHVDFYDTVGMLYTYIKKPEIFQDLTREEKEFNVDINFYQEITQELSEKFLGPVVP